MFDALFKSFFPSPEVETAVACKVCVALLVLDVERVATVNNIVLVEGTTMPIVDVGVQRRRV